MDDNGPSDSHLRQIGLRNVDELGCEFYADDLSKAQLRSHKKSPALPAAEIDEGELGGLHVQEIDSVYKLAFIYSLIAHPELCVW